MTKEVTFTPAALQAVIAEAVAVALAARDTKPARQQVGGWQDGSNSCGWISWSLKPSSGLALVR